MNYQIKPSGESLTIQLEFKTFEFEINDFLEIRKNSESCSDKFLHLAEKDLDIPLDFFFDLAKKINLLLPSHKIDWLNTFIFICKRKYDKSLNTQKQDVFVENEDFFDALADDDVEIELSDFKTRKAFLDGINDKLISEGIITE